MFFVPHFGHAKVYETSIWTPCFQISAKTLISSMYRKRRIESILIRVIEESVAKWVQAKVHERNYGNSELLCEPMLLIVLITYMGYGKIRPKLISMISSLLEPLYLIQP